MYKDSSENISEKETVLVWLDFGPYSYMYLAIAAELSKKGNFDFIGIVTTQQDVSFFEKQNFVKFKKLFYYPDCYIGKTTFDIKNIKKIEDKFDLQLWLDAFTERSFYKFWTYFHKFSREEILMIIEQSLEFFIEVLEKYNPKLILMQQVGENISNLLLYRLAKKMEIKILMVNDIHFKNHIMISDNITNNEISNEFERRKLDFKGTIEKYDESFPRSKNYTGILKTMASFDSGIDSSSQKIIHYFKRLSNDVEPIYKNFGKSRGKMLKHRMHNYFEFKKREKFLEKNTLREISDEKFLYFPLQSEPEAAILMNSSFYSNQIGIIENIAKAIPIDYVLYVKEHPLQKIKLWRPIKDYQKIIDIPNVKFFHPNVNAQEILKKSKGIISISGATGFEALFYKKPVILFSNDHYDGLSMVTKVNTMNELPKTIVKAISDFRFNQDELGIFMGILKEKSLPVVWYEIMKDAVSISSIQRNHQKFELTEQNFEKFLEKHNEGFKLIVDEIFLKYQKKNK